MKKTDILTKWPIYKQQTVNDLAWLIHSPGLLNNQLPYVVPDKWWQQRSQYLNAYLEQWDAAPNRLPEKLKKPRPVIGDYFENLVAFSLAQLPDITDINHRRTVIENKKTIGEFDFLFYDLLSKHSYHWEVAVKFYLYSESEQGSEFYGPNSRDRLSKKYARMCHHQILLSEKPAAAAIIADYPTPLVPQILLKGFLFYPTVQHLASDYSRFDYISPNHLRGWWTYAHQLEIPMNGRDSKWLILSKPYWLAVNSSGLDRIESALTYKELYGFSKTHFHRNQTPLFLAEVMQNTEGECIECSRGFIVPQGWPNSN